MNPLRWTLLLVGTIVLLAIAGGVLVWVKIAGLKDVLVHNLEAKLGARVQVTSLSLNVWDGEMRAAGITLVNQRPEAPWDKGSISQAVAKFHFRDLFAEPIPLTVEVSSWSINFIASTASTSATSSGNNSSTSNTTTPSAPKKIKVTTLTARGGEVNYQLANGHVIALHGVGFEANDNGGNIWTTELRAEAISAGAFQAGPSAVQIRGEPDKITFSKLRMQCDQGVIAGEGTVALDSHYTTHLSLVATDIPIDMLIGVNWQMKIAGLATGSMTFDGDTLNGSAHGQLSLAKAKFNVLPWLGKVTSLVGLADISNVEVDKATTDFDWKNHTLTLSNLDIRKTDVVRIAGTVDLDPQGQVDGKLKLGLPSSITTKWPSLQEKVFSVQSEDYNWADVHLTGPPDHLQEDLTARLLSVGTSDGTSILNQTTQKAMDLLNNFLK